jgi:hypothetical protein
MAAHLHVKSPGIWLTAAAAFTWQEEMLGIA